MCTSDTFAQIKNWSRYNGENRLAKNKVGRWEKKSTGRLPLHITPLQFLVDPNHCKKVVGKKLYAIAIAPQKLSRIDKGTCSASMRLLGCISQTSSPFRSFEEQWKILHMENASVGHVLIITHIGTAYGAINCRHNKTKHSMYHHPIVLSTTR